MKANTGASPRRKRGWAGFILIAILAVGAAAFVELQRPPSSGAVGARVQVAIPDGATASQIAAILQQNGLIRYREGFRIEACMLGKESLLKAGRYEFTVGQSVRSILEAVASGRVVMTRITIPEGSTARQIAHIFAVSGLAQEAEAMALVNDPPKEIREAYPFLPYGESLEGYLFPDTYEFADGVSPLRIIRAMLAQFQKTAGAAFDKASFHPSALSDRDALILASVVEKEAKAPEERSIIAQVFLNRLERGMPLQSCATVQYLLPVPKERLLNTDLEIDSPYNTYINKGLPPGPISNPGLASITAVLTPKPGDYLYFVAAGDGSHIFSRTYEEHLRAKAKVERGARLAKKKQ
ncbi:MAG: endolytic transglycosylase MltG [Clostridia bacterium]|nr:endolytic transglycosylase MltG [Clostridia bacterium]